MLILNSYKSHVNADFEAYYKENNIIPLYLLFYSFYLTQPLNINCFNILKLRYGNELIVFIKAYINHITKVEFFQAFCSVYFATMIKENILGVFRGAGLIPFNPEAVIFKLDV